jgi:DNA-binding transcriptional ArsR family regulator
MDVSHTPADADSAVPRIAAAIGEPARARMLYCLLGDQARTATELALVADVSPSTASVHLGRLQTERLVRVFVQGRHRYYSLGGPHVADVLESLSVLAGSPRPAFAPSTPTELRAARTCYDHLAGSLGVMLHDRITALGWLQGTDDDAYALTAKGAKALATLGIDVDATRRLRRRFAFACLDWSERRPHVGGAIGAALLDLALRKKWVARNRDSRAVRVTALGRRDLATYFGVRV